jgi:hypothetical protein
MFKRLNKLEEAESELLLSLKWAKDIDIIKDIQYNLACVYAMYEKNDQNKEKMLIQLNSLLPALRWEERIKHRKLYFKNYLDDPDFNDLIDTSGFNID